MSAVKSDPVVNKLDVKDQSEDEYIPSDEEFLAEEIFDGQQELASSVKEKDESSGITSSALKNALERIRSSKRSRLGTVDQNLIQKTAVKTLTQLDAAYEADLHAVEQNKPAINRVLALKKLEEVLRRFAYVEPLLRAGLLERFQLYLTPLRSNNESVLTTFSVRSQVYTLLDRMKFSISYLEDSQLGSRLLSCWADPEEAPANKTLIRNIVLSMYNQIVSGSAEY